MSAFGTKRTCVGAPHMSAFGGRADMRERLTFGSMEGLGRVERTDGDVVPVKLPTLSQIHPTRLAHSRPLRRWSA